MQNINTENYDSKVIFKQSTGICEESFQENNLFIKNLAMWNECRVCWKKLRSQKSIENWAWPVCLRREREKFWHWRRTPAKNQMSFDSKRDILDHYKNWLDQRVVFWKEDDDKQYKRDLALQKKCEDLWWDEKFFEHLRWHYVQGNDSEEKWKSEKFWSRIVYSIFTKFLWESQRNWGDQKSSWKSLNKYCLNNKSQSKLPK